MNWRDLVTCATCEKPVERVELFHDGHDTAFEFRCHGRREYVAFSYDRLLLSRDPSKQLYESLPRRVFLKNSTTTKPERRPVDPQAPK